MFPSQAVRDPTTSSSMRRIQALSMVHLRECLRVGSGSSTRFTSRAIDCKTILQTGQSTNAPNRAGRDARATMLLQSSP